MAMYKKFQLIFFLQLYVFGCLSSVPTIRPLEDFVDLVISPTALHPGLTARLTVTCSAVDTGHSEFPTLLSIILSKAESGGGFTEIASVTSSSPDTVDTKVNLGAQVSGQLNQTGQSYIRLTWSHPDVQSTGQFRCEAFGMDHSGHPLVSTDLDDVTQTPVDMSVILHKLLEMENNTELLKAELAGVKADSRSRCAKVNRTLVDVLAELDVTRVALNITQYELRETQAVLAQALLHTSNNGSTPAIESSARYQSHNYFLSVVHHTGPSEAREICEKFKGYLVEINDKAEFDFINTFLANQSNVVEDVIIGSKKNDQGQWVFSTSRKPMTYFNWGYGHPIPGTTEDCMRLWRIGNEYKMANQGCHFAASFWRFICEIL